MTVTINEKMGVTGVTSEVLTSPGLINEALD